MGYSGGSLASITDHAQDQLDEAFRRITERCGKRLLELVIENTPVAPAPHEDDHRERVPGTLKRSWRIGDVDLSGVTYSVDIYTDDDIARFVEYRTRPHRITAKPGHSLRFRNKDGEVVYAHSVMHPGTTGQRMMGRAIARLAQEWQAIARDELRRAAT